jgi:hypothetical protein
MRRVDTPLGDRRQLGETPGPRAAWHVFASFAGLGTTDKKAPTFVAAKPNGRRWWEGCGSHSDLAS